MGGWGMRYRMIADWLESCFAVPFPNCMKDLALSESRRPPPLIEVIKDHLVLLFGLLGLMWGVEILDHLPYIDLDQFGIRPRSVSGLPGILFAPFLHAGFGHLLVNSLPFVILGGAVLLGGVRL